MKEVEPKEMAEMLHLPARVAVDGFTGEETDAMRELRDAGRELEATYRAHMTAKERHQAALGKLHRIWGAVDKPAGG